MRRQLGVVVLLVLSVAATPASGSSLATQTATQSVEPVSVVIVFDQANGRNASAIRAVGGTVTGGHNVSSAPILFASVPQTQLSTLRARSAVVAIHRDTVVETTNQVTPWGVDRINGRIAAQAVSQSAQANVTVAVLDTGVDIDHEDLHRRLVWGVNTTGDGPVRTGLEVADDTNGHGTHVAGTVAAMNNDQGTIGVAPNVSLYAVQVTGTDGVGSYSDLIQGIDRATKGPDGEFGTADDADVVTMSLGGSEPSRALELAVANASEHAVVLAAAGNSGDGNGSTDDVLYPAAYNGTLAIGATNKQDRVPDWSGSGPAIDVVAPGVGIYSTDVDNSYTRQSGTSMATPHVAGTAALLIGQDLADGHRNRTADAIAAAIRGSARDIEQSGPDSLSGYGLINASRALSQSPVGLNVSLNRSTVLVNRTVRLTVSRNDSNEPINATVTIDGNRYWTGDDGELLFFFEQSGQYTLSVAADATQTAFFDPTRKTLTVQTPARFNVTYSVNRTKVELNDTIGVTATIHNTGDGSGSKTVVFYADDTAFANTTVTLAGSERTNLTKTITFTTAGNHTLTVNEAPSTTISVRRTTITGSYDTNGNNLIDTAELLTAVSDWQTDRLSTHEFLTIIRYWRTGTPV